MKKLMLAAVLVLLAAPLEAQETFVHGQSGNPGFRAGTFVGGMASDSTGYILPLNATGSALYTAPVAPDGEQFLVLPVIDATLTAGAIGDSCTPQNISGYRLDGLLIDTDAPSDLVVQLRYNLLGVDDSTHTFPVAVTAYSLGVGAVAAQDSIATGVKAGPAEFYIPLRMADSREPDVAGIMAAKPAGNRFVSLSLPNGATLPRMEYANVRVRAATATNGTVAVRVWMVGSAIR